MTLQPNNKSVGWQPLSSAVSYSCILVEKESIYENDPNVYLSKTFIDLRKAYITLSSQDTFKIINKSEVPNEFEWRAFANEGEEKEKKTTKKKDW